MFLVVQFILLVTFLPLTQATVNDYCNTDLDNFQDICENVYNGFVDGGRCFFYTNITGTWQQGWDVCRSLNATMAQIHTTAEFNRITTYLKNGQIIYWIALKHFHPGPIPGSSLAPNDTFWHDDFGDYNPKLIMENTWLRTRLQDDVDCCPPDAYWFCFVIYKFSAFIGNGPCDTGNVAPMCHFINTYQRFTPVSGWCIAEVPFEQEPVDDLNSCGILCTQQTACRSFNYFVDGLCQLFSWSILDNPKNSPDPSCTHYTYVK